MCVREKAKQTTRKDYQRARVRLVIVDSVPVLMYNRVLGEDHGQLK